MHLEPVPGMPLYRNSTVLSNLATPGQITFESLLSYTIRFRFGTSGVYPPPHPRERRESIERSIVIAVASSMIFEARLARITAQKTEIAGPIGPDLMRSRKSKSLNEKISANFYNFYKFTQKCETFQNFEIAKDFLHFANLFAFLGVSQ